MVGYVCMLGAHETAEGAALGGPNWWAGLLWSIGSAMHGT